MRAINYIHDWNALPFKASAIELEDDTLRDGLQGTFLKKLTLEQKLELIELSINMGVTQFMLGFPAASESEYSDCFKTLKWLEKRNANIQVYFLARAKIEDLTPIIQLSKETTYPICADFFVGVSKLRRVVENWDYNKLLSTCEQTANYANEHHLPFSISLEDATRTTPDDIKTFITLALTKGAKRITLCDTVGALVPQGVFSLISSIRSYFSANKQKTALGWHGHNDNGLALANALAAVDAGIDFISGTFLGIGERSGNTALEQVIFHLLHRGHSHFSLTPLMLYSEKLAKYVDYEIPSHAPLVGSQAFATSTGTHTNAIVKAKLLGSDFEDLVFSSVPAAVLNRRQELYLNHNSGLSNVKYLLTSHGITATEDDMQLLLEIAKKTNTHLTLTEIKKILLEKINVDDSR